MRHHKRNDVLYWDWNGFGFLARTPAVQNVVNSKKKNGRLNARTDTFAWAELLWNSCL